MEGRVFIIGLGLIGGSLALCIKKEHPASVIVGFDINREQSRLAKMLGVIDEAAENIPVGAKDADLIIVSAPVNDTKSIIRALSGQPLKPGVIVTDTGSTKTTIVDTASSLKERGITFIGGHPMAGSHKTGVSAARDILFENAFYLLTPEEQVESTKVEILKDWLKGTKAKFLTITAENHDYLTGIVSHFPHIIAASIVRQTEKLSGSESLIPRLAAGGFRDITRIASSSPQMWKDILLHNRKNLISLLDQWSEEMQGVKAMLESGNAEDIYEYFQQAKQFRDELPSKEKGAIPAFYDLYVDIPDVPGIISEVTGYLAQENISIVNIRILETREDINGVLVISFQTEQDRQRAEKCILTYTSYSTSNGS
ncbi:prephenate dehydrogenase [Neobacillus niacini]|uniref:prephenate dehydrogenase n=1 Tax=Neobacillus niacini TaxID=86668 RepID=UPI0021CB4CE5|nr:prephenate dehydrogenase [Neobacillus niacini]MCM3766569.1 prephenate dehydrogenase [Neobacillus niacini]